MLLAIDAGNSTVSFGFFDKDELRHVFRAESRTGATPDEYLAFLLAHMSRAGIKPGKVEGVVISSVVPTLVQKLFEAIGGISQATPLVVTTRLKLGIGIKYKTPNTLGADRIASVSGAFALFGGPVIVVDFGTATTVSVVDAGGSFLGGMIAPGLLTGYEALVSKASGVPKVGLTYPGSAVGKSTGEGLQSGLIYGHAAMADGLLSLAKREIGGKARAVATGGLAGLVVPHMTERPDVDTNLTLKGLSAIYRINSDK